MDAHLQHCTMVENDTTGRLSIEYGVNSRTSLLELETFDICSGTLLPDVMHDILEGVLQHVLQLLLTYCIDEKQYFTLKMLNDKIEGVELGYMEDTRPAIIDNCKHLRQNGNGSINTVIFYNCKQFIASQSWTLGRLLPLMIGSHIPEDDAYWCHYTSLLQIVQYALAPEINKDEVALLQVLITNFLSEFTDIYPGASVIPKMHYMLHIPRLTIK